jgi:putative acetyltransferase
MEIIQYQEKYREDFVRLNTEWLERFYTVEPYDQDMMDRVEEFIEKGGMVYFAIEKGKVLSTCMTMPLYGDVWEMCKLASVGQYTGTGAGSAVFKACMDYAISKGAKKLSLISCKALKPAIHIYEKFGFKEVPLNKEFWGAEKADIEMEYKVD